MAVFCRCNIAASLWPLGPEGRRCGPATLPEWTVGSGKTTVANAISDMETTPHALINLDAIRRFSPTSEREPFNHELEFEHLAEALG